MAIPNQIEIANTTNNVTVQTNNNQITVVNESKNIDINILQPAYDVIQVAIPGPAGPPGITPILETGSLASTGSNNFVGNQVITGSVTATLGFTGSLFGTASFATTSSFPWIITGSNISYINGNVGIGGIINSTGFGQKLRIIGQGDAAIGIYRNQASSSPAKIEFMKSRGTYDVPLVVNNLDELGSLGYFGFNGTSYSNSARVYARAVSSTGTGVEGELLTTLWNNTGGNLNMLRLTILGLGIGNALDYAPSARLQVRGDGTNPIFRLDSSTGTQFASFSNTGNFTIGGNVAASLNGSLLRSSLLGEDGLTAQSIIRSQNNAGSPYIWFVKTRGTLAVPIDVVVNDGLSSVTSNGYLNGATQTVTSIVSEVSNIVSTTLVGRMRFVVNTATNNESILTLTGNSSQGSAIIGRATNPLSKLHVRGEGATASTTALRVENSNASASLVVLDNGFVGIGTATPSASFHVSTNNNDTTLSLRVSNDNAGGRAGLTFNLPNNTNESYSIGVDNDRFLKISNGPNLTTNTRIVISTTGNVGIGTASPYGKLQVFDGDLYLTYNSPSYQASVGQSVYFGQYSGGQNIVDQARIFGFTQGGGGGILAFYTAVSNGGSTEKVRIDNLGNVGIRTTTPAFTLDVSGSGRFTNGLTVTGSLTVTNNLTVLGSASIQYISESVLNIGTNLITVNTLSPTVRFGGLAVIDSGSSPLGSGSFLYDSVQDEFIFVHRGDGTNITSSHFLVGPETYNNLGNEIYVPNNTLLKSQGNEHVTGSNITDTGILVNINSNTSVTGSLIASSSNATQLQVGSNLLFVSSSGRVGVGTTNPISSLHIVGSGISNSTFGLVTYNSSNVETFQVRDDGAVKFGTGSFFHPSNTRFQINNMSGTELLRMSDTSLLTVAEIGNLGAGGLTITGNASLSLKPGNGNSGIIDIGTSQVNTVLNNNITRNFAVFTQGWNALSGSSNLTMNALTVANSINFVSSSGTNIGRGLYVNPTLTGVSDFRAIETTAGSILFQSGSTPLFFVGSNGNVGIGTSTPTSRLDINNTLSSTVGLTIASPQTSAGSLVLSTIGTPGINNGALLILRHADGTFPTPGVTAASRVISSQLSQYFSGSSYVTATNIIDLSDGKKIFGATPSYGGTLTYYGKLDSGNWYFGDLSTTIGTARDRAVSSRVQIQGSGTTSSTTAFRVENSNATASLVVRDDLRVGINNASPAYTLDVDGNAQLGNNNYYARLTSGGSDGGIFRVGGPSYGEAELRSNGLSLNGGHSISGTGGTSQFSIVSNVAPVAAQFSNAGAAMKFIAENSGSGGGVWPAYSTALAFNFLKKESNGTYTSTFSINGNGNNIGIGTITPAARLHVSGSASGVLLIASSSAGPALFVSGSGRVGIGTNTPTTTLDVFRPLTGTGTIATFYGYQAPFQLEASIEVGAQSSDTGVAVLGGSNFSTLLGGFLQTKNGQRALSFNQLGIVSIGTAQISSSQYSALTIGGGAGSIGALVPNKIGLQLASIPRTIPHTGPGTLQSEVAFNSFGISSLSALVSPTTYTNAYNVYIDGAPTAGSAVTFTNRYALYVNSGSSYFGGNVGIGTGTPTFNLDVSGSGRFTNNVTVTGSVIIDGGLFDTTTTSSLLSGSHLLYSFSTASYQAGFFDYYVTSGSNFRAGTIMSVAGAGTYRFTDQATPDIGDTTNLQFSMSLATSNLELYASASSNGWTVKTTFRTI